MASLLTSTCWPTRFLAKWVIAFLAAVILGILLGFLVHRRAAPPRVQINLEAYEVYTDGIKVLVPAHVQTGGIGDQPIPESDQGATSTDMTKPLLISRAPGTRQWLIFQWQGVTLNRRINPWPQSPIPYVVVFDLKRHNPHPVKQKAAH